MKLQYKFPSITLLFITSVVITHQDSRKSPYVSEGTSEGTSIKNNKPPKLTMKPTKLFNKDKKIRFLVVRKTMKKKTTLEEKSSNWHCCLKLRLEERTYQICKPLVKTSLLWKVTKKKLLERRRKVIQVEELRNRQ